MPRYILGEEVKKSHHQKWDARVRKISKGLTIFKSAKGQWISPDGELFYDSMIPVRITCSEKQIDDIIQMTIKHYKQKAVMAYEISKCVKVVHENDN